jgi:4-diphosphocytidyl-2-C-methyl-D-erythritol kinase
MRFAVVKPGASIATREIFEHPRLVRDTDPVILTGSPEGVGGSGFPPGWLQNFGKNDLQAPAEDRCPEVAQATRWLEARYGNSRMTGSGSAVFARVGTVEPLLAAFPTEELPAGWVGRQCRSLSGHPLAGWAS